MGNSNNPFEGWTKRRERTPIGSSSFGNKSNPYDELQKQVTMLQFKDLIAQQRMPGGIPTQRTDQAGVRYINPEGVEAESTLAGEIKRKEKLATEEAGMQYGAKKELSSSTRFAQLFERSFDEINKKLPGFDQLGMPGIVKRTGAKIFNRMKMLPETRTLQVRILPMANQMARDVEGGRVTDQDRAIYANAFANTLSEPTETNARLISEHLVSLADKGGDITKNLAAFSNSNNPVLQMVYKNVIESFPEYEYLSRKQQNKQDEDNDPLGIFQ